VFTSIDVKGDDFLHNPKIVKIAKDKNIYNDFCIGYKLQTQVNASIGTSTEKDTFETELEKAITAEAAGAAMITDHSIIGDIEEFHKALRKNIHIPLSTVPIYELAIRNACFSDQQALEIIEEQLARGFNFLTLHATVLEKDIYHPISNNRLIPITSKGGAIMLRRMKATRKENPFYSLFDEILKIFKKYNAAISLGPTYRPASICDNVLVDDDAYWIEMNRMSTLVKRAIEFEVPIIVEGIGHAKLNCIPEYVRKSKEICCNVPYRVLSVSTDIALGYDHISSAIASAVAALNGANIITAVSSAEHIGLPDNRQVEEAVICARIAAHSADLCAGIDIDKDMRMSIARSSSTNCQGNIDEAIFPMGARKKILESRSRMPGCSMCGKFCALMQEEELNGK